MVKDANPQEPDEFAPDVDNQTVEFRSPDGSANIYFLLAGLAVAARHGQEMKDALACADRLYAGVNIFEEEHSDVREKMPQLPASCWESADCLLEDRKIYEDEGVFSPVLIDGLVDMLKGYDDKDLSERLYGKEEEIEKLVDEYLHCS